MSTKYLTDLSEAAQILRSGGLLAFPTETVFGLGADARNPIAIKRLFAAKGRPSDNPLIVHLSDVAQWPLAARQMTPTAEVILQRFAPGPITVVLPKQPAIDRLVTAGLDSVGLRFPSASPTRELLRLAGIPIAAPSANLSGRPSCTTWQSVAEDLDGRVDAILKINIDHLGLESTVVDCTGPIPIFLRPGAISLQQLRQTLPATRAFGEEPPPSGEVNLYPPVNSPGLKHPHYQPQARVELLPVSWNRNQHKPPRNLRLAYCGLSPAPNWPSLVCSARFTDVEQYAAEYYEFLRQADRLGADVVLVELVAPPVDLSREDAWCGLAAALHDRQLRSAGVGEAQITTANDG